MFEIKNNPIDSLVPIITGGYRELLVDELPVLYTGTNQYGSRIIGSLIFEDTKKMVTRSLHLPISIETYYQFLRKEITYLQVISEAKDLFFIDEDFKRNKWVFPIKFENIPTEYLPTEDSYYPEIDANGSLEYCFSLKGGTSDDHKAEIRELGELQENIVSVLESTMQSLHGLELNARYYAGATATGSLKLNYSIEFANAQTSLFAFDKEKIGLFVRKYLDFVVSKLPNEKTNVLRGSKIDSKALKEVDTILIDILSDANINMAENVRNQNLLDNINDTAIKFEGVSEQIKSSHSFNKIELTSNNYNGTETPIGLIDREYFEKIKDKVTPDDDDLEVSTVEADKNPKKYRILVYVLNTENGHGKARLYFGEDEDFDRVSLQVVTENMEINKTTMSQSLHEGKVVEVMGVAKRINGKFKSITVNIDNIGKTRKK